MPTDTPDHATPHPRRVRRIGARTALSWATTEAGDSGRPLRLVHVTRWPLPELDRLCVPAVCPRRRTGPARGDRNGRRHRPAPPADRTGSRRPRRHPDRRRGRARGQARRRCVPARTGRLRTRIRCRSRTPTGALAVGQRAAASTLTSCGRVRAPGQEYARAVWHRGFRRPRTRPDDTVARAQLRRRGTNDRIARTPQQRAPG